MEFLFHIPNHHNQGPHFPQAWLKHPGRNQSGRYLTQAGRCQIFERRPVTQSRPVTQIGLKVIGSDSFRTQTMQTAPVGWGQVRPHSTDHPGLSRSSLCSSSAWARQPASSLALRDVHPQSTVAALTGTPQRSPGSGPNNSFTAQPINMTPKSSHHGNEPQAGNGPISTDGNGFKPASTATRKRETKARTMQPGESQANTPTESSTTIVCSPSTLHD